MPPAHLGFTSCKKHIAVIVIRLSPLKEKKKKKLQKGSDGPAQLGTVCERHLCQVVHKHPSPSTPLAFQSCLQVFCGSWLVL